MSKVSGPPFEGIDDPPKHLREFAAECMELAQTTPSPEKRMMYLKMAALFHQMAPPGNRGWSRLWRMGLSALACLSLFRPPPAGQRSPANLPWITGPFWLD